jgi:hypothetical protein
MLKSREMRVPRAASALTTGKSSTLMRETSEILWWHLFRETVANDIVNQDDSMIAMFKVQKRLDLEDMRTGFNYLQRFAKDIIKREAK